MQLNSAKPCYSKDHLPSAKGHVDHTRGLLVTVVTKRLPGFRKRRSKGKDSKFRDIAFTRELNFYSDSRNGFRLNFKVVNLFHKFTLIVFFIPFFYPIQISIKSEAH